MQLNLSYAMLHIAIPHYNSDIKKKSLLFCSLCDQTNMAAAFKDVSVI